MEYIKKYYKNILLVCLYTFVAISVYICWFHQMWHLWYVDLITAAVILIVGVLGGFFWIRTIHKAEIKKGEEEAEKVNEKNE